MARCPWEQGKSKVEIDSSSSGTGPEDAAPQPPPAQPTSQFPEDVTSVHWTTSKIAFPAHSVEEGSSYGASGRHTLAVQPGYSTPVSLLISSLNPSAWTSSIALERRRSLNRHFLPLPIALTLTLVLVYMLMRRLSSALATTIVDLGLLSTPIFVDPCTPLSDMTPLYIISTVLTPPTRVSS